jgi:hypothetical protein
MSDRSDARVMLERAEQAATAGNFASADELLRRATRIQEETLGPLHPDLANTFNNLAIVAEKRGNLDDAETFYRRAVAIASASLSPEDPMVATSRENLESFCRARGLPIDAATPPATFVATESIARPSPPGAPKPTPDAPVAAGVSHVYVWVAIAIVVLLAVLFALRPWSSGNASGPASAEVVPPRQEAPSPGSAAIEPSAPPNTAPLPDHRGGVDRQPAAQTTGAVSLVSAELCRNFSTSEPNWRCERVDTSVAPGLLVLYTRVRSARTDAVVHRWYHGNTLRQSVRLAIGTNTRDGYRTYSRQTVKPGDWRVEVRSADGNLLDERRFSVR